MYKNPKNPVAGKGKIAILSLEVLHIEQKDVRL